jgi:putative ABC transport system permease protein
MSVLRLLLQRLFHVFRPGRGEADLDREIAAHLLLLEDECRRRGQSADEARRFARLMLGGVEQTKELHREARSFAWLDHTRRDAAYAVRILRRRPIATTAAIISLAIGTGLNAAVFSVMDWVLLRPLPYPAPHELIRVFTLGRAPLTNPSAVTYPEFLTFGGSTGLRNATAFSTATRVMSVSATESVHVSIARVCGDLFGTLGVYPMIGRAFSSADMSAGAPVVILSHDLWQRSFLGDTAVPGRTVKIDGKPYTVIGVMPPNRGYPAAAEVWRPLTSYERADGDRDLDMLARLRSEASAGRANSEMAMLARAASHDERTAWVEELQQTSVADVKATLQALVAATALILLLVCGNVAALVSAGSAERAEEILIRGALGASRSRIIGQLVIESVILVLAGGALGLLVGRWALGFLTGIAPASIPRLAEVALDDRIAALGLVATLFAALAVGLPPAIGLSKLVGASGLNHSGSVRVTRRSNGRRVLVLVQVAVAVVLTAGASLLARSLQHLVAIDNGFAGDRLISVDLYLRGLFDGDSGKLFEELTAQAKTIPGVASAAVTGQLPTRVIGLRASVRRAGGAGAAQSATWRPVDPGYFETAGIPVVAGRPFASITGSQK